MRGAGKMGTVLWCSLLSLGLFGLPARAFESSYGTLNVQNSVNIKAVTQRPAERHGHCQVYCADDQLYFQDQAGNERPITSNEFSPSISVKGSFGKMLRISRTTPSMASYVSFDDGNSIDPAFQSLIGHESSGGTGLFGSGSPYALGIGTKTDHAISFHTSGKAAPRLVIDKEGRVGVGKVPRSHALEVSGEASKSTSGSWLANSDARIKRDVATIDPAAALDKILALRPVSFRYTRAYEQAHPEVGRRGEWVSFIAQEFRDVFPMAVAESSARAEEAVGKEGVLQIDTHDVTVHLVSAVQQQERTLRQLERRVKDLERRARQAEGGLASGDE